jgi:arabinofuranosyltransferase
VFAVLLASRTCVEFATSGLEAPLAMLLLAWLARLDEHTDPGGTRLGPVAFAVGLCGCTRLDLLLLGAPLLLAHLRRQRPLQQLATLALALAPLIGWSLFATFYYGSPFPITAYAKAMAHGVPAAVMTAQGWRYCVDTALHDPVTLVTIAGGATAGLLVPALRGRALAIGVLLGVLYVVGVGGDFMAGRFFAPPFALSVALLARWLAGQRMRTALVVAAAAVGLSWLPGKPGWLRPPIEDFDVPPAVDGIQEERLFYYERLGLLSPRRQIPVAGRFSTALRRQGRATPIVLGIGPAGVLPFEAGDLFHFVDPFLCDPLLARLPVIRMQNLRIGHFERWLPDGYPESLAFDDNRIEHAGMRRFYGTLRTVLRAPLLAPERWQALANLLFGDREDLRSFTADAYHNPLRRDVPLDDLRAPRPEGTFWFDDPGVRCVGRGGLRLHSPVKVQASELHVAVTTLAIYSFHFLDGANEVGSAKCTALFDAGLPAGGDHGDVLGYLRRVLGLRRFAVALPAALPPFDTVLVDVLGDPWVLSAIGAFELSP